MDYVRESLDVYCPEVDGPNQYSLTFRRDVSSRILGGEPKGKVTASWMAKEAVREFYTVDDRKLTGQFIDKLIRDMNNPTWPSEMGSLGRTLSRWPTRSLTGTKPGSPTDRPKPPTI